MFSSKRSVSVLLFISWMVSLAACGGGTDPHTAFALVSPGDGAAEVTQGVSLTWNDTQGEVSYTVEMATDENFATLALQVSVPADTATFQVPPAALTPGTEYFWRVSAVTGAGQTLASNSPFQFGTARWPGAFELDEPANDAVNFPVTCYWFTWSDAPDATSYTLEISSDEGFSAVVSRWENLTESHYVDSGGVSSFALASNTTYYWRVIAINDKGETLAGNAPSKFTTVPASGSLTSPIWGC